MIFKCQKKKKKIRKANFFLNAIVSEKKLGLIQFLCN